jgi:hypothetical protein
MNWNPSSNWKCESSSSDSESNKLESCLHVIWSWVKAFFRFLVSLVSFLMLCTMLELSLSLATVPVSCSLMTGAPSHHSQVKHVLSFQYSLSKVALHWPLPHLPPLPPFWVNDDPSDEVILGTTTVLLYLLSRCRVCWWVLGYWLLPVVKSFLRSTLRLPHWAPLWCRKA